MNTPLKHLSLKKLSLLVIGNCILAAASKAATYNVNSASQLASVHGQLNPGDTVIWADGTYSNQTINFNAAGQSGSPITLKAETPGGVEFTGNSEMNIGGSYLIVEGFYWNQSSGSNGVIEFRESGGNQLSELADHCTIRNCAFDDLSTTAPNKSRWIILYGQSNTVENCSLIHKNSTGASILVELTYLSGATAGHVIQNNYFYDFPAKDGYASNQNDSEAIRIGVSSEQTADASVLVQHNYFVETNGENEVVSNKSRNNVYFNNTFRRCRGGLVMRHGSGAWVEGNFFLGEGASDSGGIRIIDEDHVIINNYLSGLRGTTWNAALSWVGGNTSSGGTSSGYQYVDNVVVAHNTIYDCTQSIYFNDSPGSTAPTNSYMANNLVYSTLGELIQGDEDLSPSGITFEGNILSGSSVGYSTSGISTSNPSMSLSNGLYRPSSSGPAANAAVSGYSYVDTDIDGQTRPSSGKDVGADEVSGASGSIIRLPIEDSNVGYAVGCSFLDSDGDPITGGGDTSPTITTTTLPNGTQGSAYSQTLNVSSGDAPFTWSVSAGSLPPGLSLGSSSGTISGTPTSTGTYSFTAQVSDSDNDTDTQALTLEIESGGGGGSPAQIGNISVVDYSAEQTPDNTADKLVDGTIGDATGTRWSASGFPNYAIIDLGNTYSVSQIVLYPYQDRPYQYTVSIASTQSGSYTTLVDRSSNTAGADSLTDTFTAVAGRYVKLNVTGVDGSVSSWTSINEIEIWGVLGQPDTSPSITTTTLPDGTEDESYTVTLQADGGEAPLSWTISSGFLPAGLSLSSGGTISGTPTTAGTANFTVMVEDDDDDSDTQALSIEINEPAQQEQLLSIAAVDASADDGNVPSNTLDDDLGTRWSAENDGQWIRFQLSAEATVTSIDIAMHNGDQRTADFEVEVSSNGTSWTNVLSLTSSSGNTLNLETYDLTDTTASWVRIVGYGNSYNNWNSITEVDIYGIPTGSGGSPYQYYEAEDEVTSGWQIATDSSASNGEYLAATSQNTSSPPSDGTLSFPFSLTEADDIAIWVRVITPSSSDDSCWIRVPEDSSSWTNWNGGWNTSATSWYWREWATLSLTSGSYTLEIKYREDGFQLDQVLVTSDTEFDPGNP